MTTKNKKVITLLKILKANEPTDKRYKLNGGSMLYMVRRDGFKLSILLKNLFNK